MTMATRILIADDQELIRHGFRMMLDADSRLEVVGDAANGEQAIEQARERCPDVMLMDLRMPVLDGIAATAVITAELPEVRVLALTTFDLDEYAFGALHAGASGFLLKDTRPAELADAIIAVHGGDAVVAPRITAKLIEVAAPHLPGVSPATGDAHPDADGRLSELTARERDVFELIAGGATNSELCRELHLSESTVKTHVGRILHKLGLRDRVQMVILAYELGVASPDSTDRKPSTP